MTEEKVKCKSCGELNEYEAQICVKCGSLIDDEDRRRTRTFGDADYEEGTGKWGSARITSRTNLVLGIEGETRSLVFKALEIEELVLGRSDPKTGDKPEVDLTDYGAMNKGVSRKHAVIQRKDGSLYIIDQKSANGTYLNGQKLFEYQERVLRDSDDVRLGHLTIRITLESV